MIIPFYPRLHRLQENSPIKKLQGTEFFFCVSSTLFFVKVLKFGIFWAVKCPLKTGFRYAQVTFGTGLTVYTQRILFMRQTKPPLLIAYGEAVHSSRNVVRNRRSRVVLSFSECGCLVSSAVKQVLLDAPSRVWRFNLQIIPLLHLSLHTHLIYILCELPADREKPRHTLQICRYFRMESVLTY